MIKLHMSSNREGAVFALSLGTSRRLYPNKEPRRSRVSLSFAKGEGPQALADNSKIISQIAAILTGNRAEDTISVVDPETSEELSRHEWPLTPLPEPR